MRRRDGLRRVHELGRSGPREVDHHPREPRPRLHDRRRACGSTPALASAAARAGPRRCARPAGYRGRHPSGFVSGARPRRRARHRGGEASGLVAGLAAVALCAGAVLVGVTSGAERGSPARGAAAVPKPKHARFGGDPTGGRRRGGPPHAVRRAAHHRARTTSPPPTARPTRSPRTTSARSPRPWSRSRASAHATSGRTRAGCSRATARSSTTSTPTSSTGASTQDRTVEKLMAKRPPQGPLPEIKQATRGFVARLQRLPARRRRREGRARPALQRRATWVRPLKEIDIYRRYFQLGSLASSGVAIDGISRGPLPAAGGSPLTDAQREGARARAGPAACATSAAWAPTPTASAATRPTTAAAWCSATRTSRGPARSGCTRTTSRSPARSTCPAPPSTESPRC